MLMMARVSGPIHFLSSFLIWSLRSSFFISALLAAAVQKHARISHTGTCDFYTWIADGKIRFTYKHSFSYI